MQLFDRMDWRGLRHEYGVDAKRLLPWPGVTPPFGGAWVVVAPHSVSVAHVNEPADEEEFFVCCAGRARVFHGDSVRDVSAGDVAYFPPGTRHWIENPHDEPCHLYCLWWNHGSVTRCLESRSETA